MISVRGCTGVQSYSRDQRLTILHHPRIVTPFPNLPLSRSPSGGPAFCLRAARNPITLPLMGRAREFDWSITVRVKADMQDRIERLANQLGKKPAEVIRRALPIGLTKLETARPQKAPPS